MKQRLHILLLSLCFTACLTAGAASEENGGVDVKEVVLGHLGDAYDWHIMTWNGRHVSIPLPCIVYSEHTGWHMFLSSAFHHSASGTHEGFFLNPDDNNKIYEKVNGAVVKPWDISITKDVLQIWIVAGLLLFIFLRTARWYKHRDAGSPAPKGFTGLVEMFVMMIYDDVIKGAISDKHYRRFAPYLLTCFFFIFLTNLLGLLPIFPGGANVTGNITITFFLSICTFLVVNLSGNKEYWKEIFWPEVPTWLKAPVPMMPVIEFFGIFTKPFALMVRLFANMLGGHAIILSLTCVIFITCQIGAGLGAPMTVTSFVLMIFMNCLELLVAFIQAYVFTMLSAIFIGLALPEHHGH